MYSHIVSEFLYQYTYDEKHRFIHVPPTSESEPRFFQKGLREYLLCSNCEGKFSKYEDHARRVLLSAEEYSVTQEKELLFVQNVNYAKFRLFWLSLLWRMSVSSLDIFQLVKLGEHEELFRQRLLLEEPGQQLSYPSIFMSPLKTPDIIHRSIAGPSPHRILGYRCYLWFICGLVVIFVVDKRPMNEDFLGVTVNPSGTFPIMKDLDGSASQMLNKWVKRIHDLYDLHKMGA